MKFKTGDEVQSGNCILKITKAENGRYWYNGRYTNTNETFSLDYDSDSIDSQYYLIKTNMNIKETFALALTPEPQKSFRKVGITNGDNLLTDDGMRVFLTWLLGKNQDDFKKEIVDDMVKEWEKNNK